MPKSRLGIKRRWRDHVNKTRARNSRWQAKSADIRKKVLGDKGSELYDKAIKARVNPLNSFTSLFSTSVSATLARTEKFDRKAYRKSFKEAKAKYKAEKAAKDTSGSGRDASAGKVAGTYGQTKSSLFRRLKRALRDLRKQESKTRWYVDTDPDNTDDDIFNAQDDRQEAYESKNRDREE